MYGSTLVLAAALAVQVPPAMPDSTPVQGPWTVDQEESVVAVVTHRAGFAARLAHNHMVVAKDYLVRISIDPDNLGRTVFDLEALAMDLQVDDPELKTRWEPRLAELDIVDELGSPGPDDRAEIRETMLSDDQLDAESFPRISVTLLNVREEPTTRGDTEFPYVVEIAMRIREETARAEAPARFEIVGNELFVEALAEFAFEDFGIKPYSAFMGSVKNKNEFEVFLSLKATR